MIFSDFYYQYALLLNHMIMVLVFENKGETSEKKTSVRSILTLLRGEKYRSILYYSFLDQSPSIFNLLRRGFCP